MTKNPIDLLREEAGRLGPAPAARIRIAEKLRETTADHAAGQTPLDRDQTAARRRPRHRRLAISAAIACPAAVLIALTIALAPEGSDGTKTPVVVPSAAAAALQRAADAAGQHEWAPLAPGEYHHVYVTTFDPAFPEFADDPGAVTGGGGMGPRSYEAWLGRDGHGQILSVDGSPDPSRYPTVYRNPKTGNVLSTGGNSRPADPPATVEESLAAAATVNLMVWPRTGPARQVGWVRTRSGYEKTFDFAMTERTMGRSQSATSNFREYWGVTIAQLDSLPEAGPELDRAMVRLLDSPFRSNRIPTGAYGVTADQVEREERIRAATNLLGSAPLSPNARRSLFQWLAKQPGSTLDGSARDGSGRPGTSITFQSVFDEQVPARTLTSADLVQDAIDAGARDVEPVRESKTYEIPAHREFRRWFVRVIVDIERGELLEIVDYTSQTSPEAAIPELMRTETGATRVLDQNGPGGSMFSGGARRFGERDRVTSIQPISPVCDASPEACEIPRGAPSPKIPR